MANRLLYLLFVLIVAIPVWSQCSDPNFDANLRACAQNANSVCDFSNVTGSCTINPSPLGDHTLQIATHTIVKLNHTVVIFTNDVIKLAQASVLMSANPSATGSAAQIHAVANFLPGAVIELDTGQNVLQDISVEGHRELNAGKSFVNIFVNKASRVELTRVRTEQCPQHGILIFSDAGAGGNQSTGAKLINVESWNNNGSGILSNNTADVFVSLSEMASNGQNGFYLLNSVAWRIEHSDSGHNTGDGITGDAASGDQILVGDQFAFNTAKGFNLSPNTGNLVVSEIVGNGAGNGQW